MYLFAFKDFSPILFARYGDKNRLLRLILMTGSRVPVSFSRHEEKMPDTL